MPGALGTGSSSTMMVMMMAMTPSVKLFSRWVFMRRPSRQPLRRAYASASVLGSVGIDRRLSLHPLDQFVELDGLLGCGEGVVVRKSTFTSGLIRFAGGRG